MLEILKQCNADVLIFDNEISPAQQRNWETESKILVIDRHEIILDVFLRKRAQTKEAKLQVKLARLEYSLPRLRRAWTHLSRQRGGGVTQRGEGEAQIELDQRMVRDHIAATRREILQVSKQRANRKIKKAEITLTLCCDCRLYQCWKIHFIKSNDWFFRHSGRQIICYTRSHQSKIKAAKRKNTSLNRYSWVYPQNFLTDWLIHSKLLWRRHW